MHKCLNMWDWLQCSGPIFRSTKHLGTKAPFKKKQWTSASYFVMSTGKWDFGV